jgi:hypothetical protein
MLTGSNPHLQRPSARFMLGFRLVACRRCLLSALLLAVWGCGGGLKADNSGIPDASVKQEAGGASSSSDAGAARCMTGTAGASLLAGRVPQNHRSSGSTCARVRAPAPALPACPCAGTDSGTDVLSGVCQCGFCDVDSQCDAGVNGRCENPPGAPFNYPGCSYDECFSDSDCEAGVPCTCRPSASSGEANVCWAGGNCRVDSDCGANGYCSPSLVDVGFCQCTGSPLLCGDSGATCYAGSEEVPCDCGDSCGHAYYCHSACDDCIDDSDCDGGATCNYDVLSQHWACATCWGIP